MRISLLQLNPVVGDLTGNAERLVKAVEKQAAGDSSHLLVTSELFLSGYPPRDLLLREDFVTQCDDLVRQLAKRFNNGPAILIGHPTRNGIPGRLTANAVSLLSEGKIQSCHLKMLLPTYDVFDEERYFVPGSRAVPMRWRGLRLGVHICEDAWWSDAGTRYACLPESYPDPVRRLTDAGVDLLINLSASPFEADKYERRLSVMREHCQRAQVPAVFVNQVGGNDDLVFDGGSFVLAPDGKLIAGCPFFEEDALTIDPRDSFRPVAAPDGMTNPPIPSRESRLFSALVTGLRDYMRKSGFRDVIFGLSGGIDSALACCIAAEACGPAHVHVLLMPSRYSSDHSVTDSVELARALGLDYETIPIDGMVRAYESAAVVGAELALRPGDLPEQNLQARIRGNLVMLRSNTHGWLPVATGNKSELSVGYCTLYGDMVGGFAVLSDLYKRDVYALCRDYNQRSGRTIVPENILNKDPSAELAPDQKDTDSLPPYPVLDAILERLVDGDESANALYADFPQGTVDWVIDRLDRNEYKRFQMPPGVKLTPRAFGSGRRMPMAARFPRRPGKQ